MKPLNFDMDGLRTMLLGVELGGFSHAAARLHRSASAVSMQLRRLESQAGQRLFRRVGRGLVLTAAGEIMLRYARRVLEINDEMGSALGAIAQGGTVRVGMPQDFAEIVLQPLLARYAALRPLIHVEVKLGRNDALRDDVANGRLDLALSFESAGTGGDHRIATVPGVWVGGARAAHHVLKDRPVPLLCFDGPCLFRDMGIEALARARITWRLAMTTPSLAGLWCGVRAGLGLTARTTLGLTSGLAPVPATAGLPPLPSIDIVLHCAQDVSAASRTFRDLLLESVSRECAVKTRAVAGRTVSRQRRRARA